MDKEYHLYLYPPDYVIGFWCLSLREIEYAIENEFVRICTFQVISCTTDLFRRGYRVFVHAAPDDEYEIKLGKNERTNREIKMGHCLYKLILSGEFEKENNS